MRDLLRVEDIHKHYDGVYALKNAHFAVSQGEVHALMGGNGAGKSTLAKIIGGAVTPDRGKILLNGVETVFSNAREAQRAGIGIIFQELDLFPHLSVAENIAIGNRRIERDRFFSRGELRRFCEPYLQKVGLDCRPDTPVYKLPIGHMQLVAIARALSFDARLIVMDEPTSAIPDDAVRRLFGLIRELKERDVSIVYVSHKLDEIFEICDRVTVLRDGATAGTRPIAGTTTDQLVAMMIGRELAQTSCRNHTPASDVVLSVSHLTTGTLNDVSFPLHKGEVLGIAGLVGAGRSELGAALFGLDPVQSGAIEVHGHPVSPRSPAAAMRCGIGLLPEDRKLQGLMMQMSIRENTTISILNRHRVLGFIRKSTETAAMKRVQLRTSLQALSDSAPVSTLSGGNQQKVLLGKWLLADPDVLFLDEPTRGIDVAAKREIYRIVDELAASGKSILFVSSELPELLTCCDRIMVLHEGRNMGIMDAGSATQESILALATGGASC